MLSLYLLGLTLYGLSHFLDWTDQVYNIFDTLAAKENVWVTASCLII